MRINGHLYFERCLAILTVMAGLATLGNLDFLPIFFMWLIILGGLQLIHAIQMLIVFANKGELKKHLVIYFSASLIIIAVIFCRGENMSIAEVWSYAAICLTLSFYLLYIAHRTDILQRQETKTNHA